MTESTSIHNEVLSEIERLSARRIQWPKLSETLEDRFEQNMAQRRAMHLWREGLVAIILFDLFAIADYCIGDGVSWQTVFLRGCVVTPLALLVNASMRWKPGKIYREASVALVICVAGLIHLYVESNRGLVSSAYAQSGVIIALLFANLVMRLRFSFALATSFILLAGDLVFLHLDPFLNPMEKALGLLLTGCAIIITIIANYSFGRDLRLVYLMLLRNEMQSEELAFVNAELHRISSRDNLTGLANRHSFELHCDKLWQQAVAARASLSAVLIDIDRFKAVNDRRGHLYGDKVLTRVASLLQQSLRGKYDFAARFGGEEFVVLLPETAEGGAMIVAERIRKMVETAGSPAVEDSSAGPVLPTTVSCGVATCLPDDSCCMEDLLDTADKALYEAKRSGRNRVCSGVIGTSTASAEPNVVPGERIGAYNDLTLRNTARKMLWG